MWNFDIASSAREVLSFLSSALKVKRKFMSIAHSLQINALLF